MFFLFMDQKQVKKDQLRNFPNIDVLAEFVDVARAADPTLSVAALAVLVQTVRRMPELCGGEMSLRDVADKMGLPYSSFVRNLDRLGKGSGQIKGLKLLDRGPRPANKRERQVKLTAEGTMLVQALCQFMVPAKDG